MNVSMIRQYIPVQVRFTPEGKMLPRALKWIDDEVYKIDRVKQIRPAYASKDGCDGDRYTIMMRGRESYLYFERNPEYGNQRVGRWYVEVPEYE